MTHFQEESNLVYYVNLIPANHPESTGNSHARKTPPCSRRICRWISWRWIIEWYSSYIWSRYRPSYLSPICNWYHTGFSYTFFYSCEGGGATQHPRFCLLWWQCWLRTCLVSCICCSQPMGSCQSSRRDWQSRARPRRVSLLQFTSLQVRTDSLNRLLIFVYLAIGN